MRIVFHTAGRWRDADVHIERADATIGDLAQSLDALAPAPSDRAVAADGAVFVDDRHVDPRLTLGEAGLRDGAVVSVGGPAGVRPDGRRRPDVAVELCIVSGPEAGRVVPLPPGRHRIGRAAENQVVLAEPTVSRVHAELLVWNGAVLLTNLSATSPTLVDGVPAPGPVGELTPAGAPATPAGMQAAGVTPAGSPFPVAAGPDGEPGVPVPPTRWSPWARCRSSCAPRSRPTPSPCPRPIPPWFRASGPSTARPACSNGPRRRCSRRRWHRPRPTRRRSASRR